MMKSRHTIKMLVLVGVVLLSNGGCLSLNMFNRETAETNKRIDSLERRVTALETANAARQIQPSAPANVPAMPKMTSSFPGYSN
jgi:hypothetical protein